VTADARPLGSEPDRVATWFEDDEIVFERFTVVWPPKHADLQDRRLRRPCAIPARLPRPSLG